MSTLANITSLNLSLQTGGAALAVKSAGRLVAPARTVFVYGTADDVAPNFTTVAGAITYANSLAPDPGNEPVVIRLFAKTDNAPYDLTGLSTWTTYANNGIYFVSDFVRLNETTTLPTTLPPGLQVWYIDLNGVETLWVGREDGSAWPAVGYKEYVAFLSQSGTDAPVATVLSNTLGSVVWSYEGVGQYHGTSSLITATQTFVSFSSTSSNADFRLGDESGPIQFGPRTGYVLVSTSDVGLNSSDDALSNYITIRIYP
jgi:hypothetical protein